MLPAAAKGTHRLCLTRCRCPLPPACCRAKWKGRGKKKKGKKAAGEDLYALLGLQNEVRLRMLCTL